MRGEQHLARLRSVSRLIARRALGRHMALVLLVGVACIRAVRLDPCGACERAGLDRVFRAITSRMRTAAHILYEFRTAAAVGAVARATARRADVELLGPRAQLGAVPALTTVGTHFSAHSRDAGLGPVTTPHATLPPGTRAHIGVGGARPMPHTLCGMT
eukprot:COSAG02_NODE_853_length_16508_cov_5.643915_5_plen_159_part_00